MPSRLELRIVAAVLGIVALSLLIWFAGPLLAFGTVRPLDPVWARVVLILLVLLSAVAVVAAHRYRSGKAARELERAIGAPEDTSDAAILSEKMQDALATLRKASGPRSDYLYELPWYVLIGPPGAGKTTALINSGLNFPLARGATPAAVAGVGGTRYCDWWFTEQAVLIDTAGRYTTHDSDAAADRQSWFAFLDLLKKNRPRQPINGVLVAISVEDLLTLSSAELSAHAAAIRARLLELHGRLKVDFPVYVLFTKADFAAGFSQFFEHLNEAGRRVVWGATFQTADKTRNLVGDVPQEFDALVERLNEELPDRLQEEPNPTARALLFGFPTQMAALKRPVYDFLNLIFEPTRYHANATLRGFYFTSGTQQGTPIDQLIGSIAKTFGVEEVPASAYSGLGKSFFLTDLLTKVVFGEASWVSTDRAAVRRAMAARAAAYTVLVALCGTAVGAWWTSYGRNSTLITGLQAAAKDYRETTGPLPRESQVDDRDFSQVLPLLHKLRHMPAGYAVRHEPVPVSATFGLSQHERLLSASQTAYQTALERMFRSRLLYRLEERLEAGRTNPAFLYEALKVYLMLGGQAPMDRDLVTSWMRQDWAENLYPGAANVQGRKALEEHLEALLDLSAGEEVAIALHGPLVEEIQKTLARLSVAQRAYELLRSQARSARVVDWVAARGGGPDAALVFTGSRGEDLDGISVPAFFTYAGFHHAFIDRLGNIAEQLERERWVLGSAGEQSAVAVQYERLPQDLLDLYTREFVSSWRNALSQLKLRPLTADKPSYAVLGAAAAPTSPIKQLLESVRDETTLTRERKGTTNPQAGAPQAPQDASAPAIPLKLQDRFAPGAAIEAAFRPLHQLVEGEAGRRPIDALLASLNEIHQQLTLAATNPTQAAQANAALQTQVASLRAVSSRFTAPFSTMLGGAAGEVERTVTNASLSQVAQALGEQVTRACQQTIANRYPFQRGSDRDVPLNDFARLFAPNGVLDRFFSQQLAPLADTSRREWAWRQDSQLARALSGATLRSFQKAAEIRDAFFPGGGAAPSITLSVTPPVLTMMGTSARLEFGGAVATSEAGVQPQPVSLQWPAPGQQRAAVSFTSELGEVQTLERSGSWSLHRLLDAGTLRRQGERISASFVLGGQELTYEINTGSVLNPLSLPALRDFRCPSGM